MRFRRMVTWLTTQESDGMPTAAAMDARLLRDLALRMELHDVMRRLDLGHLVEDGQSYLAVAPVLTKLLDRIEALEAGRDR